ncbi:MAG: TonB-dependent receptor plug domain-containing protein [Gemmatimonadales bacterium]
MHKRRHRIGIISLAAAGSLANSAVLSAQTPDTTRADTTKLEDVQVRVAGPILTVGGASGVRLRIDSLPLPSAPTLEQVLRQLPFLHVRRNSRGEAELSARGSESRQVAVLVDGVPINLAWDAKADVSIIPAAGFQEVRFVRGLSSMLYGPNTLGGIVEISVGRASYRPPAATAEVASGLDHVGTYGGSASVTVPIDQGSSFWLVRGGMSYRDSPGLPLARGITEPGPDPDLRLNTDSRLLDGFGAVRYEGGKGQWFSVSGSTFRGERGIAAELGYDDARFWRYPHVARTLAVLSGGTGDRRSPFGGRGDLEASIGVDWGRTEIDAYTSRSYQQPAGFEDGNDRTITLRLLGDQTLGLKGDLRSAFTIAEVRHDEFLPDGAGGTAEARYRQRLASLGVETVWRLFENRGRLNVLRLSLGGAYDIAQTPETGGREPGQPTLKEWGTRIGATAVLYDGYLQAHGGVSRRGRFPSLRELYSGSLNRFAPNPELRPENLVAAEAGATVRVGDYTEFQVVGFRHQLNDAVVRIILPDQRFMRVNRDRLTSHGLELVASTVLGRLDLRGDLTLQSVKLSDPEAGTTARPENLPEVFGGISGGLLLPSPLGLRIGAELRYTGTQFCLDPATGDEAGLPAGAVLNSDVARQFRIRGDGTGFFSQLEARVAVDNIGNKALYDQCRLPEPGRLARVQIRLF